MSKASSSKLQEEIAEDPNELGAKLIKAELMGDDELVESLKLRLEKARKFADNKKNDSKQYQNIDKNNKPDYKQKSYKHKQDFRSNLNEEESKVLKRNYKYNKDDEYDDLAFNSHSENSNKKMKKKDFRPNFDKEISFTDKIKEKEETKTIENCECCFENAQKHLVISIGKHCYLCLPSLESFVEGNCFIIPMSHVSNSIQCDEEIWNEIKEFKRALVNMFDKKRMECIFYELYTADKKYSHLKIECIPLGMNVSNLAPIYFKKAIMESESEWATSKKVIDLKDQNLRNVIPKNMPYFCVNFGLNDGYAHVIENTHAYPEHFAKEIIGGILDLDPLVWMRPRKDDFNHQSKKVIEFLKWWKPFDFNKN